MCAVDELQHVRGQFPSAALEQSPVDGGNAGDAGGGGDEIVADHDDGDGGAQVREQVEKADFSLRVDVGSGLVKKEQGRVRGQGPGHQNALFLSVC